MTKIYSLLIIFGVVGAVLFGAWYEYKDMQTRMETLRENNAKLAESAKANADALTEVQQFAEQMAEQNATLQQDLQKAESYKDDLLGKLQKHDLALLSLKKPGLIETRINNATAKVFDEIESITKLSPAN